MGKTITSFSPTHGVNGTVVTINGTGLGGIMYVTFGGTLASSLTVNSDTQITATVGAGTSGPIIATDYVSGYPNNVYDATATSTTSFTYSANQSPSSTLTNLISSINPSDFNQPPVTFTSTVIAQADSGNAYGNDDILRWKYNDRHDKSQWFWGGHFLNRRYGSSSKCWQPRIRTTQFPR